MYKAWLEPLSTIIVWIFNVVVTTFLRWCARRRSLDNKWKITIYSNFTAVIHGKYWRVRRRKTYGYEYYLLATYFMSGCNISRSAYFSPLQDVSFPHCYPTDPVVCLFLPRKACQSLQMIPPHGDWSIECFCIVFWSLLITVVWSIYYVSVFLQRVQPMYILNQLLLKWCILIWYAIRFLCLNFDLLVCYSISGVLIIKSLTYTKWENKKKNR